MVLIDGSKIFTIIIYIKYYLKYLPERKQFLSQWILINKQNVRKINLHQKSLKSKIKIKKVFLNNLMDLLFLKNLVLLNKRSKYKN